MVAATPESLGEDVKRRLKEPGWRFGHFTGRALPGGRLALDVLLLDAKRGAAAIYTAELAEGVREYPALTPHVPAAHWAERAVGEMFGVLAVGHPRWKSLRLHAPVWPEGLAPLRPDDWEAPVSRAPYEFMRVKGEGIHEIPVGPIHAGIIEPGHFRFSCMGEIVTNLEIRLGYQHRGIEKRLQETPWAKGLFLAEAVSTDTAAGNALAHAVAVESLLGVTAPPRATALRTVALEIERLANHVGDLGALAGDIGYNIGPALFPTIRGAALALAVTLTGNRRQRWYIRPGGVARDLPDAQRNAILVGLSALAGQVRRHVPLILEHPGVLDRMEGTGRLSPSLAKDFGVVGPAGRASASRYDARCAFHHGAYPDPSFAPAHRAEGDVLARARIRADEIDASIAIIETLLENLPTSAIAVGLGDALPAHSVGVGVVEAWRGELIHWISTDGDGRIARYAVKDPSFNNWTGLAVAMRGNMVADFPLCNKSFNLSYSGNDL
jgi:Ni,Fe-hydrogenase III large subunit